MWIRRNVYTVFLVNPQKKSFSKLGHRNYKIETKSTEFLKTGIVPTSEMLGILNIPPKNVNFESLGVAWIIFGGRGRTRENLLTNFHFVEFCLLGYSVV
jgi:hypothetical protein